MKSSRAEPSISGITATAGSSAQETTVIRKPCRRLRAVERWEAQAKTSEAPATIVITAETAKAMAS